MPTTTSIGESTADRVSKSSPVAEPLIGACGMAAASRPPTLPGCARPSPRPKADGSRGACADASQANPGFENSSPPDVARPLLRPLCRHVARPRQRRASAFDDYVATSTEELEGYDKPVAYLHGDTHLPAHGQTALQHEDQTARLKTSHAWRRSAGPTRHWVRITVDPSDPALFRFDPQIVPENVVNRRAN